MENFKNKAVQIDLVPANNIQDPESKRLFESVQGAYIIPEEQCFQFGKRNSDGELREVIFEIEDNHYLGNFIDRMPYGIINKKATGIGATTLEIERPRNSIIVVPTKSLAYTKFLKYRNAKYVGSPIGEITSNINLEDIQEYNNNNEVNYKKILVVADSLPKVIDALGTSVFNDYFIMIDEIDVVQSDSGYRPNLENAMDYYFMFPKNNRCVVSATIRDFSHPELENETIVTIVKKNPLQRNIKLYYSENENINGLLKEQIENIATNYPNQKILIAYNSIRGIMAVIGSLSLELQSECGILCSAASEEQAKPYFQELQNSTLICKITFITSAYFVGIDIDDRFHLITVCNSQVTPQSLTLNKITQIHGRCRNSSGVYSDTILYSDSYLELDDEKSITLSLEDFKSYILNKSKTAIDICNHIEKYKSENIDILEDTALVNIFYNLKSKIAEASVINSIPTIRVFKNRDTKLAYFNIDNLLEQKEILELDLYSKNDNLKKALETLNHIVYFETIESAQTRDQIRAEIISMTQQNETKIAMAERAIEKIRELITAGSLNDVSLNQLIFRNTPDRTEKQFCERFKELYRYIPAEPLFVILKSICINTSRVYKAVYNMLKFWALDEEHLFKIGIRNQFSVGRRFTVENLLTTLNPLLTQFLSVTLQKQSDAVSFLGYMFEISSTSITISTNTSVDGYVILDSLPEKIEVLRGLEPIIKISKNETLLRNQFKL